MPNIPSYSEDMLPRHFPISSQPSKNSPLPMPTIPGVSLTIDDEKLPPKIEPKQSFEKWKQKHEAIFADTDEYEVRSEKKHVRFETNHNICDKQKRRSLTNFQTSIPSSPNLELSFYEPTMPICTAQQNEKQNIFCQQNVIPASVNEPQFENNFVNRQSNMAIDMTRFRQMRSDSNLDNRPHSNVIPSTCDQRLQLKVHASNGHCCRSQNQNGCEDIDNKPKRSMCCHEIKSNCCGSHDTSFTQDVQRKLTKSSEYPERQHLNDETLYSIMEEQQQHILMQQNQILMQQKQILMQQNQIFIMQHQIDKLLKRSGDNSEYENPTDKSTSPGVLSKFQTRNESSNGMTDITNKTASIGVMTSYLDNKQMPNEMFRFNEEYLAATTQVKNDKLIDDRKYDITLEKPSAKDSMLDRINEVIRNSPTIDYKTNQGRNYDTSPKPNQQSGNVNIEAKTVIYETSRTNNGPLNDYKTTDRSFALYMLGMKYCPQNNIDVNNPSQYQSHDRCNGKSTDNANDKISVNVSPEAYDYLIRHGLLNK